MEEELTHRNEDATPDVILVKLTLAELGFVSIGLDHSASALDNFGVKGVQRKFDELYRAVHAARAVGLRGYVEVRDGYLL